MSAMAPCLRFLILACVCLHAPALQAQPRDPLAVAERAYLDVDFRTQRSEAKRALESGYNDAPRLVQLYRLLGLAEAALGDTAAAKHWFLRLLALEPDVELERLLSPRVRSPYLEARGFWDASTQRWGVEILWMNAERGLGVHISDPLGMAARARVRSAEHRDAVLFNVEASRHVEMPAARFAQYAGQQLELELLDEHGNVLAARTLPIMRPIARGRARPTKAEVSAASPSSSGHLDDASLLVAGSGVAGLGVGVFAHVVREKRAREWNSAQCERAGLGTRGSQCATVDQERASAQRVALVAYSAGGTLLLAGLVMHLMSQPASEEPARDRAGFACGIGPGALGLACSSSW